MRKALRINMELPGVGLIDRSADTTDPWELARMEATILYLFDTGRLKKLRKLATERRNVRGLTDGMSLDDLERCGSYYPDPDQFERVYFVLRRDVGELKIGTTRKLGQRIDTLQSAHGGGLELLGAIRGGLKEEERLHERFAHLRLRGEWFYYRGELEEYLATICPVSASEILAKTA